MQFLASDPFPKKVTRGWSSNSLTANTFHQVRDNLAGLGFNQFINPLGQPFPLQGDRHGLGAVGDLGAAHNQAPLIVTKGSLKISGTRTLVDAGHSANKSANVLGVNGVLLCVFPK